MARAKARIPDRVRLEVAIKHGAVPGVSVKVRCAYCPAMGSMLWHTNRSGRPGSWVAIGGLELDHIIPESRGGSTSSDNLTLACRPCNRKKGARV